MKRTIGLWGATVTLVGLVVGISIFILPGALAASTGPAVIISYALASFLTLFTCAVSAQIGSVFPVSGASYTSISRLVSPFFGFVSMWMMFGGACMAIALLSYGFADYLQLVMPATNRTVAAYGLVFGLVVLNLFGLRDNVTIQAVMVAIFIVALGVFTVAGISNLRLDLLTPFVPNGWQPVWAAAIPAFFSYAGFMVIIDIGGEIKNPGRTIPRAMALSFSIVLVIYLAVSLAVVGTIPWQELGGIAAPVGEASRRLLPGWTAGAITLAAIAAAATSINGLLLGYSRDVLALARAGIFPEMLAKVSRKHGEPVAGVLFLTALSLLALTLATGVTDLATLIAVALLSLQVFLGIAVLRLPSLMPQEYAQAEFRLKPVVLKCFGIGLIAISAAFLFIAVTGNPLGTGAAALYFAVGCAWYLMRQRYLSRNPGSGRLAGELEKGRSGAE